MWFTTVPCSTMRSKPSLRSDHYRRLAVMILVGQLSTLTAQRPDYTFRHWSARQGLAENKVTDGIVSDDGFYWFTTGNELNRFDGYGLTIFPLHGKQGKEALFPTRHLTALRAGHILAASGAYEISELQVIDPHALRSNGFENHRYGAHRNGGIALPKGVKSLNTLTDNATGHIYLVAQHLQQPQRQLYRLTGPDAPVLKDTLFLPADLDGPLADHICLIHSDTLWQYWPGKGIGYRALNGGETQWTAVFDDKGRTLNLPLNDKARFFYTAGQVWMAETTQGLLLRYHNDRRIWEKATDIPAGFSLQACDGKGNFLAVKGTEYAFYCAEDHAWEHRFFPEVSEWNGFVSRDFKRGFFAFNNAGIYQYTLLRPQAQHLLCRKNGYPADAAAMPMRGMVETDHGELVLASEFNDLFAVQPGADKPHPIVFTDEKTGAIQHFLGVWTRLVKDRAGYVWLYTTQPGRLYRLDVKNRTSKSYELPFVVYDMLPMRDGALLLASKQTGLYRFDPVTGQTRCVLDADPHLRDKVTFCLFEDADKIVWIGTTQGLYAFDPAGGKVVPFAGLREPRYQSSVTCIEQTDDGRIWVGTLGQGLLAFLPDRGQWEQYDRSAGLANAKVAGMLRDGNNLWVSTYYGLSYFAAESRTFINFYEEDGLSNNEFNRRSYLRSTDGRCWMGSLDGITVFRPEQMLRGQGAAPRVLPVQYAYFYGGQRTKVVGGLDSLRSVSIPAQQRACEFVFTLDDFSASANNQFAYRLGGYEQTWHYIGGQNRLVFDWLPAGRYLLEVKGADSYGNWSEPYTLNLHVAEIFYRTFWFNLLIVLGVAGLSMWYFSLRARRKAAHREAQRLRELDGLRNNLYTRITHEFRTPLTLLLGPTARLLQHSERLAATEIRDMLLTIQRNGSRLLQLVNQILDLRKLEDGRLPLRYEQGDILFWLRYAAANFDTLADDQHIHFVFDAEAETLVMDYDREKLLTIVNNLLSNAFKFTPPGGSVIFSAQLEKNGQWLVLSVRDTGTGIATADLPHIFDQFYQATQTDMPGSGIGLTLVKELVELLGGHVRVESESGKGSTFWVQLPVRREAPLQVSREPLWPDSPTVSNPLPVLPSGASDSQLPLALIVEDSAEIAHYVATCLSSEYRIEWAENGRIGLEKAFALIPDLVVSDLMMPEMDGFALTSALKDDERTSHVPVILLTALAETDSRIEGFRRGADAYLSKPFHEAELQIIAAQQVQLRRRLRQRFAALETPMVEAVPPSASDPFDPAREDAFFQKILRIIQENIANEQFGVPDLSRAVHLSPSQLQRKLAALTNQSALQIIRTLRLRKAQQLLRSTGLPVSEIAWATGFSDPSYFTRMFSRACGVTPTEWRNAPPEV